MVSVLAVAIAALCFIAYVSTQRNLSAEVDRSLLHEAQAYAAAMKGSTTSTSLVNASRTYLQGRAGAVAGQSRRSRAEHHPGGICHGSAWRC
jgi:hypothetical protein